MVSIPRCGCQGKPAWWSSGLSPRKSSSIRKGSKRGSCPRPNARRSRTPAPSRVGLLWNTASMCRVPDILCLIVPGLPPEESGFGCRLYVAAHDECDQRPNRQGDGRRYERRLHGLYEFPQHEIPAKKLTHELPGLRWRLGANLLHTGREVGWP